MTLLGLLRPWAIDWTVGAGRPAGAPSERVDVIIPIYGAPDDLRRCLASLEAETDLARHGVILVVDGPQEPAVETLVADFASAHAAAVRLLRNETRGGFVVTVNRGMRASTGDVVLLNSDTIVTARWLEKLIDAAASCSDCGTVTPLSNHATLCSVPRGFEENLLPAGYDIASFAALVERASARIRPRLPTGVGVCLYIRRALLDDIGFFDELRFGLGYGEENDFCFRALARGWLHLADDATFIFHAGHRSFGASRRQLQQRAGKRLRRAHPPYLATIALFMKLDPLAAVRARIVDAVRGNKLPGRLRIVHLVHGWPPFQQAGTELYAWWLVRQQTGQHDVSVYTRAAAPTRQEGEAIEWLDHGVRVRRVVNNFTARNPLRRNALRDPALERDFARFLRQERPDLLHIHHLAGHAFALANVARRMGIPIVLQIQDWWFLCARVNLFDRDWNRCSGPALGKCARCAPLTKIAPAPLWNRLLHRLRRSMARAAVAAAETYIVGSRAIRDDYLHAGFIPPSRTVHVIPYGVAVEIPPMPRPPLRRPIRFGYVGSIAPHKGLHVAVEAMRDFDPAAARLRVWGDTSALPDYTEMLRTKGGAVLSFEGCFREEEKGAVFAGMDVLLVPSVGLESFGLAAREAMTCGVPVIATNDGALAEMFEPGTCGELFPSGDVAALREILYRVVDDPAIIERWSRNLPQPKRAELHATEIARVYESVLKR